MDIPKRRPRVQGVPSGTAAAGVAVASLLLWLATPLRGVETDSTSQTDSTVHARPAAAPNVAGNIPELGTNADFLVVDEALLPACEPASSETSVNPNQQPTPRALDKENPTLPPQNESSGVDEAAASIAVEVTAAVAVVKEFLAADTVEKKLPFVRFPQKVKTLMDEWYRDHPDRSIKASQDELSESLTKILQIDNSKFIIVVMLLEPEKIYKVYALESTEKEGLKVDWETAVGWQAMKLEEFIKKKTTAPQLFRVYATPSDYYNWQYSDESRWYAVRLTHPDDPDFNLHGYVERNTRVGRRLMDLLGSDRTSAVDGETEGGGQATGRCLILAIAYVQETRGPNQVTIHDVFRDHWFLTEGTLIDIAPR